MATTDPRVDAYIAKSAPFARPILTHLRALVHAGCPDVDETIKWSTPHFVYRRQGAAWAQADEEAHPDASGPEVLGRRARARATFEGFSPSQKREYLEWITEAKTGATGKKHLETAIAWMADGKPRNWKYVK